MAEALSPAKLKAARGSFYVFNVCNSFSFILLSGSFVTLFALRLGASTSFVGLLNALAYANFFFLPLGKRLVRRHAIVKVFGWGWTLRYLAMLPLLAAPLLVLAGLPGVGFGCILAGVAGFNIFRGIGLIGNNPVLAFLAEGRDRGAFLVNVQIVNNLAAMATSLLAAVILGRAAGTGLYLALIAAGIGVGLVGALVLFKTPEPEAYRPKESSGLFETAREAFAEKPFRVFIEALILVSFAAGMARSFLPVYAKEVYAQGDDLVMLYSLLGSLGSVAMGLLTRLLVDRLGAKPLYIIFTAVSALSLVPAVLSPRLGSPLGVIIFLCVLHFVSSFGLSGEENAGQTYYFSLVPRERTLDLAVVYFLAYGLGGSLGALLGGVILEALRLQGFGLGDSYRLFFGLLLATLTWSLVRMSRLVRLGSATVRESLGVIFSLRDLRAFDLLAKLDRSETPQEEQRLIHELGESASPRSQRELLGYLDSPRFEVRMEALLALENIHLLEPESLGALVAEVERNPYTTAYLAARVLGKRGGPEALPVLRRALEAEDYMLRGAVVVALARLGDRESRPAVEKVLVETGNPRVRISAAYALEIFGDRESVPALVSCLRKEDPPAYVSDELVLSIASILGLMGPFYPLYAAFLEDEAKGRALLRDAAADRAGAEAAKGGWTADGSPRFDPEAYRGALDGILADPPRGAPMGRQVLGLGADPGVELVLAEAALDPNLGYRGFRFFLASYVVLAEKKSPQ
ncbi:MAG: MFS transporter [Spirochaetaceae bacterium]|nr:MFS transporter [Spirochaetaceae bacterium]